MMKEIHEQPKAVRDTLNSVLVDGKLDMSAVGLSDEDIKKDLTRFASLPAAVRIM